MLLEPCSTPRAHLWTGECFPKRKELLFQGSWPALCFCNSRFISPMMGNEIPRTGLFTSSSSRKLWFLSAFLQLICQSMLQLSSHTSMLLRKLCPIIDKVKDGLRVSELKNHADDAVYIFISLTFKFKTEQWDLTISPLGRFLMHWLLYNFLFYLLVYKISSYSVCLVNIVKIRRMFKKHLETNRCGHGPE